MRPNPLKDWYADENNARELQAALDLPVIKKAMAVLQFVALPREDTTEKGSAEMITGAAFEQKRNSGFFSYPEHLWELTEPLQTPPKNPEGYSDNYVKDYARKHGMWEDFDAAEKSQAPEQQS